MKQCKPIPSFIRKLLQTKIQKLENLSKTD